MKKFLIFTVAVFTLVCSCSQKKDAAQPQEQTALEQQLPMAEDFKSPQGKPTVVDFFATWCGPCMQFRPVFHKAEKDYAGRIEFKTIDVDRDQALANKYGIQSIPTILFVDGEGREVYRFTGMMSAEELGRQLDAMLERK